MPFDPKQPQSIRVDVPISRYDLEGHLSEVIAKLTKIEQDNPHLTGLSIDLEASEEYHSCVINVEIYGFRTETEAEVARRLRVLAEQQKQALQRKKQQLAALKAELGEA